jgi:hypothetical protein
MNSQSSANPSSFPRWKRGLLIFSRFLVALSLSLWIGGMAFFGIMAAPVLFHPEKSGIPRAADTAIIAPQMVSAMLTRFGFLTSICAVILLVGWLVDGLLSNGTQSGLKSGAWRIQGALSLVCLTLSFYLNSVLLPRTKAEQGQILPLIARAERGETLSAADKERRVAFDMGHQSYQKLASINLYLLMAILLVLLGRALPTNSSYPQKIK